jgi:hypothetical protein
VNIAYDSYAPAQAKGSYTVQEAICHLTTQVDGLCSRAYTS